MSKQPRKGEKVDMTAPVLEVPTLVEGDCFAKEWDGMSRECRSCSDFSHCGILFDKGTNQKVAELEKEVAQKGETFLDLQDLSLLDPERVRRILERKTEGGQELSFETLTIGLMAMAQTSERVSVENWIKRFIAKEGYILNLERATICRA